MTKVKSKKEDLYSFVPSKGSWEIPRKLFHYSIGFIVFYLYLNGTDTKDVYPPLVVFLSIVITAELLRFNFDWFNKLYCILLGPLMRPTEVNHKINGVAFYLLGCVIVLYGFPRDLSALSIIYLSWADPTASICGRLWGKYTPQYGGKSLAGSLGAAIVGALVTFLYFGPLSPALPPSYQPSSPLSLPVLSFYGGFVASFSEGISNVFGLDDNLTIPVISVILLYIPLVVFNLGQ